jgi:hypothetical protein
MFSLVCSGRLQPHDHDAHFIFSPHKYYRFLSENPVLLFVFLAATRWDFTSLDGQNRSVNLRMHIHLNLPADQVLSAR